MWNTPPLYAAISMSTPSLWRIRSFGGVIKFACIFFVNNFLWIVMQTSKATQIFSILLVCSRSNHTLVSKKKASYWISLKFQASLFCPITFWSFKAEAYKLTKLDTITEPLTIFWIFSPILRAAFFSNTFWRLFLYLNY